MMHFFGRWLATLLVLFFTFALLGMLAALFLFQHYAKDLPEVGQLAQYNPPVVTRLYAADGKLLAEYATEKRIYVPLSAIPKRVIQAFIAAEDKNFYTHPGVDIYGLARAVLTNVKNFATGGHGLVGGSTITQQVVKNFLLTNERSFTRKIKEAILAFRISQAYSKNRILELYLNQIYLGESSYGVAAAALNYFNKSMDELNVEEAAFLAALPKAPSYYSPRRNYDRAKARRDYVLQQMAGDGFISDAEMKQAMAMAITLQRRDATAVTRADAFAEEVRRLLAAIYGPRVLYEGGLYVKTTLDPVLQTYADKALRAAIIAYDRRHGYRGPLMHLPTMTDWRGQLAAIPADKAQLVDDQRLAVVLKAAPASAELGFIDGANGSLPADELAWARGGHAALVEGDVIIADSLKAEPAKKGEAKPPANSYALRQVPKVNGGLVVLDPHTGRVLALSGGYHYTRNEFNRVTQARRQPGSAFKPFVYLGGLESGFTPATVVLDAPVELSQGAGQPMWRPQNYKGEYLGPATLRTGLEKSRNTMTVRLAQMIGIDKVLTIGKRFGIYDELPRNFSVVLGSGETTLMRLANAYGEIANGGLKLEASLIERIDDRNGKTIYRRDARPCIGCVATDKVGAAVEPPLLPDTRARLLDERIDYQMISMLQGVVERGTGVAAKVLARPVAGKTGTTNDSRDTWFIGFTPNLVAGVYIGYDSPHTLGARETGASVALPAFVHFMQDALKDVPPSDFRVPPGIQFVRLDRHSGAPVYETPEGASGDTINEAFVTGLPLFIPEKTGEEGETPKALPPVPTMGTIAAPATTEPMPPPEEPVGANEEEMDALPPEDAPNDYLPSPNRHYPEENRPHSPVAGTGGLY